MTEVNQLVTEHLDVWTSAIEKKFSAGRRGRGAFTLYGVKKLRELIFELAIRGKLVHQEDSDTVHLVKALERGKIDLIAKGDIKKPRQIEHRQAAERHRIPSNWLWVHLDQVGAIVGGGTPKASDPSSFEEPGDGFPWLTPADLSGHSDTYIERGARDLSDTGLAKSSATAMPKDTVLFTSRAPIGYVAIAAGPIATNQGFKSVVPFLPEMSRYIALVLRCFAPEIDVAAPGTTFKEVSGKIVAGLSFPLPPLAEQQRIVTKVDELMALCDALEQQSEDSLNAHQALVETCLATLTNSQSPEDLAQNWTRIETHFDTLFTTEESVEALKKISIELGAMGLLTHQIAGGIDPETILDQVAEEKSKLVSKGIIRREKPLTATDPSEFPFQLPRGWIWAKVGDIALFTQYGTSQKATKHSGGVSVLAMGNIQDGAVTLESEKTLPPDWEEFPALLLEPGDLLYNRTNSAELVGKTGLFEGLEGEFTFASYLIRIRLSTRWVRPKYLNFAMNSPYFRKTQVVPHIKKQTGQANVNGTILKNMLVPLPPTEEQDAIIKQIEALHGICSQLRLKLREVGSLERKLADTLTSKIH